MTRDLADTVKALSEQIARATLPAVTPAACGLIEQVIEPAIRDLIAQATADALEAAGDEINQCLQIIVTNAGNWYDDSSERENAYGHITQAASRAARAIPADIAAKAKEREEQIEKAAFLKGTKLAEVALEARDAKIRREAVTIAQRTSFRPHADDDYDYHSGCEQTQHRIVEALEKWAGGGKQ
jgi:hypothetical protein